MNIDAKEFDYTGFTNRTAEELQFRTLLAKFSNLSNEDKIGAKKGIYIYGEPGVGKSYFVKRVLQEMNYEILNYNTGMVRNKPLFEKISSNSISEFSVISMLKRKPKKIAIVIDDINSLNNGDKGCLTSLIKIIRAKKTKKHKTEETSFNPIVCIGNSINNIVKKMFDLIKTCHIIELKPPTTAQTKNILIHKYSLNDNNDIDKLVYYIQNDFNKLNAIMNLYESSPSIFNHQLFGEIVLLKSNNDNNKKTIKEIFNTTPIIENHISVISETERATIGLYWHENVPVVLNETEINNADKTRLYINLLKNICFADYVDRVTFKKQIWKFNEMSSIIKTFKTQHILSQALVFHTSSNRTANNQTANKIIYPFLESNIQFTKILTKYSNKYNNFVFFQEICKKLYIDTKDVYSLFLQIKFADININSQIVPEVISAVDLKRIYKYLEKLYIYIPNVNEANDNGTIFENEVDDELDAEFGLEY